MRLLKNIMLCAGLSLASSSHAMTVWINNGSFDAISISDSSTLSTIHGWDMGSGLLGLHNPPNSAFIGEEGNGAHRNTMYMIDNAVVSQSGRDESMVCAQSGAAGVFPLFKPGFVCLLGFYRQSRL